MAKQFPTTYSLAVSALLASCLASPLSLAHSHTNPKRVTPKTIIDNVMAHYPSIINAKRDIAIAKAKALSAHGAFDPRLQSDFRDTPNGDYVNWYTDSTVNVPTGVQGINLFAGYLNGKGDFPSYEKNFLTNSRGEFEVGAELPLLKGRATDAMRTTLANALIGVDLSHILFLQKRNSIIEKALNTYWTLVTANRNLSVYRHLLTLARERNVALSTQFTHGDIAKIVVTDNLRAIMKRRAELTAMLLKAKQTAIELSLFYRDENSNPLVIRPNALKVKYLPIRRISLKHKKVRQFLSELVNEQPAVLAIAAKAKQLANTIGYQENNLLPKLSVKLYTDKDNGRGSPTLGKRAYNAAVSFAIPLFLREARGKVSAAKVKYLALALKKKLLVEQLSAKVHQVINQINYNARQIGFLKRQAELSRKVESAEKFSFRKGSSSLFIVNQREQDAAAARIAYINSRLDYYYAYNDLYRLCQYDSSCIHHLFSS